MSRSLALLKERYLSQIKENPDLFIGIELEFPIVEKSGKATDVAVVKQLLADLPRHLDFEVEKYDRQGNPIQLVSRHNADRILFEVSYTTLEFAFDKAEAIGQVEDRFQRYLTVIQDWLAPYHHEIQGVGVHPNWRQNDPTPVESPRYEMLMQYLSLSKKGRYPQLHSYPEYGTFICGSQVQLDVSKENVIRVINAFNAIEAAKAYLFANSEFSGEDWPTKISRDVFWEQSMHGLLVANAGVNPTDFQSVDAFFDYLHQTALFTAEREGETLYFEPISADTYLDQAQIVAYNLAGQEVLITPEERDFDQHRSYQYQDLTTRGTVEFRSVCTQPLDRTFAPAAFHLGLFVNLEKVEAYLQTAPFFAQEGRDYKELRRRYSQKSLKKEELDCIHAFAADLMALAREGLEKRGYGEESYLSNLL